MAITKIYADCSQCGGDGIRQQYGSGFPNPAPVELPCESCAGTGKVVLGEIDLSDMMDTLNDIMDKCNDIFEKVNE